MLTQTPVPDRTRPPRTIDLFQSLWASVEATAADLQDLCCSCEPAPNAVRWQQFRDLVAEQLAALQYDVDATGLRHAIAPECGDHDAAALADRIPGVTTADRLPEPLIPCSPDDVATRARQTYVNLLRDELQADAVLLFVIRDAEGNSGASISAWPRGAGPLAHVLRKRCHEIVAHLEREAAEAKGTDLRKVTSASLGDAR